MHDFFADRLSSEHRADLDREAEHAARVAEAHRARAGADAGRDQALAPSRGSLRHRIRLALAHAIPRRHSVPVHRA